MNILGIIAEFNPLHTGHEYLIRHLRRQTDADYCIVVMSGDYVQRGEPAFFSKFLRTQAALLAGADLVFELPLSVSTGSAEYFALGAVSLLDRLGCVTHLGFGSESGDIRTFQQAGKLLSEEPEAYRLLLQKNLRAGMSFPKARYEALSAFFIKQAAQTGLSADHRTCPQKLSSPCSRLPAADNISGALSLLEAPNNILGIEYVKALRKLRSSIIPVTVKRLGAGYHEKLDTAKEHASRTDSPDAESLSPAGTCLTAKYASASGLRRAFLSSPDLADTQLLLQNYIPSASHSLYLDALRQKQFVTFEDFFLPLYYTLQYTDADKLSRYQDITPDFSKRLLRLFPQCSSVAELCAALKTKNMTVARVNRCLLHILFRLTKDAVSAEKEQGLSLYARILGFRRDARPLLTRVSRSASIPLVSKLADARNFLPPLAHSQLERTIKASGLYQAVLPDSKHGSEYTKKIVIL